MMLNVQEGLFEKDLVRRLRNLYNNFCSWSIALRSVVDIRFSPQVSLRAVHSVENLGYKLILQ